MVETNGEYHRAQYVMDHLKNKHTLLNQHRSVGDTIHTSKVHCNASAEHSGHEAVLCLQISFSFLCLCYAD